MREFRGKQRYHNFKDYNSREINEPYLPLYFNSCEELGLHGKTFVSFMNFSIFRRDGNRGGWEM